MIDEKKLLDGLQTNFYEHYSKNMSSSEIHIVELLKEEIVNQPKVGEWIPCSLRLPNENDRVLCITKRKRYETSIYRHGGFWACGSEWLKNVIAWKPLPDPYQGGDTIAQD